MFLEQVRVWGASYNSNATLPRSSTPPPSSKEKKEDKDVEWNLGSEFFLGMDVDVQWSFLGL